LRQTESRQVCQAPSIVEGGTQSGQSDPMRPTSSGAAATSSARDSDKLTICDIEIFDERATHADPR
jgi:hypothetical protein